MNVGSILALLVAVVAVPLNWYGTWILWKVHRANPRLRVLRDRAVAAFALAVIVTVFALIFANNEAKPPPLDGEATKIITRLTVLAFGIIPALSWLWLYRSTRD